MKKQNAVRSAMIRILSALFGAAAMQCREATRLTSEARDRKLTARERISIRIHNKLCGQCSVFEKHLVSLGAYARVERPLPPLPAEAKRRLVEALEKS